MATPQRITKDGNTLYRVQIRRPTKGIKIDKYFAAKREADAYIRDVEHAIKNGTPITDNVSTRHSFGDALALYLADPDAFKTNKGRELKASAKRDRQQRLQWLARKPDPIQSKTDPSRPKPKRGGDLGGILLKNMTWEVLDQKLADMAKLHDWTPATRYRYETSLSRFLDYCKKKGWVASNVLNDQQRLNDTETRGRTYTDSDWQSLLEAADARQDMLAMFLRLAWATGCRKSELLNLRWVDVEPFEHERLGAAISVTDTKNREDRTVYIAKETYKLLQAHEQQFRKPSSPLVFPSRTKDGRYNVDVPFREAREKAKLTQPDERYGEVLTIHHIRHTWATRLGDNGATLAQLMAAGGWRTAAMAMRYMKRKEVQSAEAALLLADK